MKNRSTEISNEIRIMKNALKNNHKHTVLQFVYGDGPITFLKKLMNIKVSILAQGDYKLSRF